MDKKLPRKPDPAFTMIQVRRETWQVIKEAAKAAGVTIPDYMAQAHPNAEAEATGYASERATDLKVLKGDFKETGRGKPKEEQWLPLTLEGLKKWRKMREDGTWEAYCNAWESAHPGEHCEGEGFWLHDRNFLMKHAKEFSPNKVS